MLTLVQAAILGILQGVTELFPVSSLGHAVLLPQILGWQTDEASSSFLAFVVAIHLATALVLLGFFWREWVRIVVGVLRSLYRREVASDTYARLGWLLIVGTIPAGLLGLLLQTKLQALFGAAPLVAAALLANGIVLFGAEALRKRAPRGIAQDEALARLSFPQAFFIGIAQSLALIPGFSRTGAAMTGGLLSGLSHENAARFAFLLATPIILAAAVLKVPGLLHAESGVLSAAIVGAICAAAAAYISVRFLTNYFKTKTLRPFAIYCVVAGLFALVFLLIF
jgi:undecaprenyl-diphosphatase